MLGLIVLFLVQTYYLITRLRKVVENHVNVMNFRFTFIHFNTYSFLDRTSNVCPGNDQCASSYFSIICSFEL